MNLLKALMSAPISSLSIKFRLVSSFCSNSFSDLRSSLWKGARGSPLKENSANPGNLSAKRKKRINLAVQILLVNSKAIGLLTTGRKNLVSVSVTETEGISLEIRLLNKYIYKKLETPGQPSIIVIFFLALYFAV
jgi:hypothetical protein